MTKQVQRRRGTATQHTSFTGAEGEISVNTTNKSTHVHDGVTAGGIEAARADLDNVSAADVLAAAGVTASAAELNRVDGVTSPIQTQIDAKAPKDGAVFTGGVDITGDLSFGDNDKAIFGAGSDLQIYHDGSDSYIKDAGTGRLKIIGNDQVRLENTDGDAYLAAVANGSTFLYYAGSNKFSTTSTGVDVTGTTVTDALRVETAQGNISITNSASSLDFARDGGNYIRATGASGSFSILTGSTGFHDRAINIGSNNDISFYEDTGTTPKFFWDASAESLGIGTNSPVMQLQSAGGIAVSSDSALTEVSRLYEYYGLHIDSGDAANNSRPIVFRTGGIEHMRITSSGSVGIGTSSPNTDVEIARSVSPTLRFNNTDTSLTQGQGLGSIEFMNNDVSGHGPNVAAIIKAVTTGSGGQNGALDFRTKNGSGEGDAASTSMYIGSNGNVGIGTSSPSPVGSRTTVNVEGSSGAAIRLSDDTANMFIDYTDTSGGRISVNAAEPLTLRTNSSDRMTIDSSGNVGIGTSSPSALLHISSAGSTVLNVEATGANDSRVRITAGSSNISYVEFADPDDVDTGEIRYNHATNYMGFHTSNNIERMRIDSSGNLLVGTTSTSLYNTTTETGILLNGTLGNVSIARSGNRPLDLNRLGTDGSIAEFRKDGTTVGSIGTKSGDVYIGTGDTALAFYDAGSLILPYNTSTSGYNDSSISLGNANYRFKDLYLSGGVYLGGTGSANKLDDYEEGTWTPSWSNSFTQGCFDTATGFSSAYGRYVKIGEMVWCYAEVVVTGTTGDISQSANYSINNSSLPFAPASHNMYFFTLHGTAQAYNGVGSGSIQSGVITPLDTQSVIVITYTGVPTGVAGNNPQSLGFQYRTTS